jgi:hypothetical protein
VTAVAVWDHSPSADELLAARITNGWRPTPTETRDGPKILGHAACRTTATIIDGSCNRER